MPFSVQPNEVFDTQGRVITTSPLSQIISGDPTSENYAPIGYTVVNGIDGTVWIVTNNVGVVTWQQLIASNGSTFIINEPVQFNNAISVKYTYVDTFTTPSYTVLVSDYYISEDSTSANAGSTVLLPNTTTTGRIIIVKDLVGQASIYPITVTSVSGATLIDGEATFIINNNYQSAQFIFNGTSYEVF